MLPADPPLFALHFFEFTRNRAQLISRIPLSGRLFQELTCAFLVLCVLCLCFFQLARELLHLGLLWSPRGEKRVIIHFLYTFNPDYQVAAP